MLTSSWWRCVSEIYNDRMIERMDADRREDKDKYIVVVFRDVLELNKDIQSNIILCRLQDTSRNFGNSFELLFLGD